MQSGTSQIKNKTFWVSAKWVLNATGWNKEDLRQARNSGMITWRHDEDGFKYDLQSIHPLTLKKAI